MEYFSNCPLDISKKKQLVSSSFCGGASLGVSVTSVFLSCACVHATLSLTSPPYHSIGKALKEKLHEACLSQCKANKT